MKIVLISDTHEDHANLIVPDGDILIHAGDISIFSKRGIFALREFNQWAEKLPHKWKILIAGNHDTLLQKRPELAKEELGAWTYLNESGVQINGLNFWGSPWSPSTGGWAFTDLPADIQKHWDKIPGTTNVLITHCPPFGILDSDIWDGHTGCRSLRDTIFSNRLENLKLHIFGHVHIPPEMVAEQGKIFINASVCDSKRKAIYQPIILDI